VKHPQDFDRLAANTIRHDVPCPEYDKFARIGHPARATKAGLVSQHLHGIRHSRDHQAGSRRIIFGDETGFDIQACA
jgi:hypothetical protein